MLARGDDGGWATVRNARLARRFRALSRELATSLELARCVPSIKHLFRKNPMGAIIPTLMHQIASKLHSQAG